MDDILALRIDKIADAIVDAIVDTNLDPALAADEILMALTVVTMQLTEAKLRQQKASNS